MTPAFGWLIVWQGALMAGCTLAAFAVGLRWYGADGTGLAHAVTIAFMALAMAQVLHAFNMRSRTRLALTSRLFTNGWLRGPRLSASHYKWRRCSYLSCATFLALCRYRCPIGAWWRSPRWCR